jgi:hypothetical protein
VAGGADDPVLRGAPESSRGQSLRDFFRRGVVAADIAEPLLSYDFDQPAEAVSALLGALDFDAAGVRVNGAVRGLVLRSELVGGSCFDHLHELDPTLVVPAEEPLATVIVRLGASPQVLVTAFGAVAGIITRADLQKPPVRMWLFGLLMMVEDLLGAALHRSYPQESWRGHLSEARLARALALQAERNRRRESLTLVDCLSFGDKWWILSKHEPFRETVGWRSRGEARERMKELETLRNQLAHGHDVVATSLPTIVRIASRLDEILAVAAGLDAGH